MEYPSCPGSPPQGSALGEAVPEFPLVFLISFACEIQGLCGNHCIQQFVLGPLSLRHLPPRFSGDHSPMRGRSVTIAYNTSAGAAITRDTSQRCPRDTISSCPHNSARQVVAIPPVGHTVPERYEQVVSPDQAAFPSGVVTFLFTDVEGSTRRWETEGASLDVV